MGFLFIQIQFLVTVLTGSAKLPSKHTLPIKYKHLFPLKAHSTLFYFILFFCQIDGQGTLIVDSPVTVHSYAWFSTRFFLLVAFGDLSFCLLNIFHFNHCLSLNMAVSSLFRDGTYFKEFRRDCLFTCGSGFCD